MSGLPARMRVLGCADRWGFAARRAVRRADPERGMVATARRRLTVQVAVAVTAAMLLVGATAFLIVSRTQSHQVDRQLSVAVQRAEDVDDPPAAVTLMVRRADGSVTATPGAGVAWEDRAALAATARDGVMRWSTRRSGDDGAFRVLTVRRGDGIVVQAGYDLGVLRAGQRQLAVGLGLAGVVGLGAAAAISMLVGRRAVGPLREALVRQRRFVADAAHELRTPLTLLHTRAQVLALTAGTAGAPDAAARAAVAAEARAVVEDSRRLAEVVEDLLVSAELTRHPARREPVDLGAVAVELTRAAAAYADTLGVTLTVAIRGSGEAAGEAEPVVLGAPTALRRALGALVDNAIAHTPGGGEVTVTVTSSRTREGSGQVAVRVADTGSGVDPSLVEQIFDRFHRGQQDGDRRRFGLGLALVRETVANHGGTIDIGTSASSPTGGAAFTITFPAAVPDPARPPRRWRR
ncbi:cell wall metabolism sensor histidine kinase WalK [Parafrankia sp. EUN1f]|uniref:sensor histidine kinase n=1 Tax=Parafrankia sp. EUN1f TaxID=102897 RepID=UPI0001C44A48|nr:HAMP domain-containing sensor histidine kinase [Parafrankia sp. EUN1f]EFC84798.1 histidine kinase [Parafrankia sp. EUN1f]